MKYFLMGKHINKEYYMNDGSLKKIKEFSIIKLEFDNFNTKKIKKELLEKGFKRLDYKIGIGDKNIKKVNQIKNSLKYFKFENLPSVTHDTLILIEKETDKEQLNNKIIERAHLNDSFFIEYNEFLNIVTNMESQSINLIKDKNWEKFKLENKKKENIKFLEDNLKSNIDLDLDEDFSFI